MCGSSPRGRTPKAISRSRHLHRATKEGTSVVNRDDEIRKRREQKRQRAADKTAQSPPIDAKLALLQHINAPEELRERG